MLSAVWRRANIILSLRAKTSIAGNDDGRRSPRGTPAVHRPVDLALFGCSRLGRRGAHAAATRLGGLGFLVGRRLRGDAERGRETIRVERRRLVGGRHRLFARLAGTAATRCGIVLAGCDSHIGLLRGSLLGLLLLDIGRTAVTLTLAARAILTRAVVTLPILTLPIFAGTIVALLRTLVAVALAAPAVLGLAAARLLVGADRLTLVAEIIVVELVEIVALTPHRLIVGPPALIGEDPEIMIRELQIIFGVDAIARHLRVAGQVLVLFEQLRRIAARATVDPVAAVTLSVAAAATLTLLATTTAATATVLTVVDQFTVLVLEPKPAFAPEARGAIVPRRRDRFGNAGLPWPPDCSG